MKTHLHDCWRSLMPRLCSDSSSASSDVLTSITLPRFRIGEPCLDNSLVLVGCTRLASIEAFDRLSPATRLCCRSAATSSGGGTSGGVEALRLPRSRGRTIFDRGKQRRKEEQRRNEEQHHDVDQNTAQTEKTTRMRCGIRWEAGDVP
jgi:hypothetical protein